MGEFPFRRVLFFHLFCTVYAEAFADVRMQTADLTG